MNKGALKWVFSRSVGLGTRRALRYVALALALGACGGALGGPSAGGESHFLRRCESRCGAGLECISGLCTQGCLIGRDAECQKLAQGATCTSESVEPGLVAVCDKGCERAQDCAGLGAGFECDDGFCRGPAVLPSGAAGAPSGSAGSASAGSSGSGSSGSGPLGEAGSAGAPNPLPACSLTASASCAGPQVCVDDASDDCDGDADSACPGICRNVFWTPECTVAEAAQPCLDGFSCTPDPRAVLAKRAQGICVEDNQLGLCARGERCRDGFSCVTNVGDCAPDRVDCASPVACLAIEAACPYGYARSRIGLSDASMASCFGPCVPVPRCGCTKDAECPEGTVCDRTIEACVNLKPWQPPSYCSLPFEDGACDRLTKVFVFEDGACRPKNYSGCSADDGNANNFYSLEECLAVCAGQPVANPCPEGHEARPVCTECGPADGCANYFLGCAQRCTETADCDSPTLICLPDGFCGAGCP